MAKSLYIANPYDKDCLNIIKNYETDYNLEGSVTSQLMASAAASLKTSLTAQNEIEQFLFLREDDTLLAGCQLQAYKDRRDCYLTLLPTTSPKQTIRLLQAVTAYAFEEQGLGMEEVFIVLDDSDGQTALSLAENGYEYLGDDDGQTHYMTDKQNYITMGRFISDGNNKNH